MKQTKKIFDAVKMMRTIRDRLSKKYVSNPSAFKDDLDKINKKYGIHSKERKVKKIN
jgi:hypothetical protein